MSEIYERMRMNRCCNESDSIKPKNWERKLSQYHFVHHKFHMEWPGIEPGPPPEPWYRPSSYEKLSFNKIHYSVPVMGLPLAVDICLVGNAVSWAINHWESLMCNYRKTVSCLQTWAFILTVSLNICWVCDV
jgi:hypothetical protein